jgi:pentatricopeptide repeat protein
MEKIRYRTQLFICSGKSCSKNGDPESAKKYFKERLKEAGLKAEVRACTCSCLDYCDDGPNIVVYPEGTLLKGVKEKDWDGIFDQFVLKKSS